MVSFSRSRLRASLISAACQRSGQCVPPAGPTSLTLGRHAAHIGYDFRSAPTSEGNMKGNRRGAVLDPDISNRTT